MVAKVEVRAEWRVVSTGGTANREIIAAVSGTRRARSTRTHDRADRLETSTYYVTAARLSLDGDEADWIVPLAAVPL
jgi:hypothetical protein